MPPTDIAMESKESHHHRISPIRPKLVVNHVLNTMCNLKIGPSSRSFKTVSLWYSKNSFWVVIYLLGSCLTIWLCLTMLNDYSSAPVLTRVTANMARMVSLPNITVCVPFNATLMFPFNSSSATPYSDSMEDFFNKTIENGKFDTTNYTEEWESYSSVEMIPQKEALFILHKYLTIMHEAEYLRTPMQNPFTSFLQQAEPDQRNALLNILVSKTELMNITIDEIKNVFIEYFKIGSTYGHGVNSEGVLYCIFRDPFDHQCDFFDTISYLDQNQICLKKHNNILQVDDPLLNYLHVRIDDRSQAIKMSNRKIIFNFNEDATPPNFAADESNIIEMIIGDSTEIYIDYESIYRALPRMSNGKLSCSYQTRRECEEKCKTDHIKKMCGCTPATFSAGLSEENKCTLAHYEKCLNYCDNEDEECRKNCPISCEQSNYRISKPYIRRYLVSEVELAIELNKYDYKIYEEEFKWTLMDLISAIGGALGLWLGIDFIVLLRFIFALVAKVFFKVSSKANLEAETSEDNQLNFSESVIKKVFTALSIKVPPQLRRLSLIMWSVGKILWAIVYLAGGVLTAASCFQLCEQYASGEMRTSMHVSFNRSISLPPATVCLAHNIDYYNINPSFAPSTIYMDALRDYLNHTNISKESILQCGGDGSSWPPVMVYVVYKYLSAFEYYEYRDAFSGLDKDSFPVNDWRKYLSYEVPWHDGWAEKHCGNHSNDCYHPSTSSYTTTAPSSSTFYSFSGFTGCLTFYDKCEEELEKAHNVDCANAIENVLIPKLMELNITVEELRQKAVYQFNSDAQLTLRFFGSNKNIVINNLRAAAFGVSSYCMHIPLDNIEFTSEKNYAEIAIESNKMLKKEEFYVPIMLTFDAAFGDPVLIIPEDDKKREQTMVGSNVLLAFGQSKSLSLRISSKLNFELDSDKCTNIKSIGEGNALHRIRYIEEMCNCSPTSWPELTPPTSRMCTIRAYETCSIFDGSSVFNNNRSYILGVPCEKTELDIIVSDMKDGETNKTVSRLRIRVEDFVYLTIEEEMTMTFKQFAVAFGGTLGIFLGLDFRFIAWLIFTPPFVLLSHLLKIILYKKAFFLKPIKNTKLKTILNSKFGRLVANIINMNLSDILKLSKFASIKKVFKNVYWLIYYTAGGILTFFLFKAVVIDYMRNNNAKVQFVPMNNKSITLPSPTICLPFFPLMIDSDHGESNIISTSFVQKYLSGKTKTELLNDTWIPAFINYVHSYLVQYGKYEWFSIDDFPKNMGHSVFFDIIDNMTNVLNITFEELREKFGKELTKMYQLNIAYYAKASNETTESQNISIHTVFVEDSKICYKPLMESLTFNSSSHFLKITANGTVIRNSSEYVDNLAPITIDLNGRNMNKKGATLLDATVSGNFSEDTSIALEIDTIIKAYPVAGGEMRCSEFLSLDQCRSACVATAIKGACKCLPRTIALTPSNENAQFCTLADYKQCSSTFQRDAFACLNGCLEPCERIRFNRRSSITKSTLEIINQMEVNLRIGSFKYQYMEEQLIYTTEEFIGEIGGALGVFTGLSVLIFIEFFYALFLRLFDICVTNKRAKVQPMRKLDDIIAEVSL